MNASVAAPSPTADAPSVLRPPAPARTPRVLWLVRAAGTFQVVTGVLFWTGNAYALIPLHLLSGLILVVTLWAIAVAAARRGVSWRPVAGAIAWGTLVVALGVTQSGLLQGNWHWVVQAVHLVVGLVAVGMAHGLARTASRP